MDIYNASQMRNKAEKAKVDMKIMPSTANILKLIEKAAASGIFNCIIKTEECNYYVCRELEKLEYKIHACGEYDPSINDYNYTEISW